MGFDLATNECSSFTDTLCIHGITEASAHRQYAPHHAGSHNGQTLHRPKKVQQADRFARRVFCAALTTPHALLRVEGGESEMIRDYRIILRESAIAGRWEAVAMGRICGKPTVSLEEVPGHHRDGSTKNTKAALALRVRDLKQWTDDGLIQSRVFHRRPVDARDWHNDGQRCRKRSVPRRVTGDSRLNTARSGETGLP